MSARLRPILFGLLFALGANCFSVHAGMIGTDQIISYQSKQTNLKIIQTALAREEVKQTLLKHGVQTKQVQNRIDQLTDEELHQLANQFADLPAGGGAGVLLLVSGPVILLLEFMGMTDLTTAF